MRKPLERNLQATAVRKFKALRARDNTFIFRKRHGTAMGVAGDPDFYGLWSGIHWELELKAPDKEPTRLQIARRKEWLEAGAHGDCAHTPSEIDTFIERLENMLIARIFSRRAHEA